jgi:heat shock protein HslJ
MGDAMVQEDAFLRELAGTHRVEFAGETLRLEHTTTQRVLTFVPDVQPRTNPRQ